MYGTWQDYILILWILKSALKQWSGKILDINKTILGYKLVHYIISSISKKGLHFVFCELPSVKNIFIIEFLLSLVDVAKNKTTCLVP